MKHRLRSPYLLQTLPMGPEARGCHISAPTLFCAVISLQASPPAIGPAQP